MKKLFISIPMKGRTKESINKSIERMHKYAELIMDEPLEVIESYIAEEPPKDVYEQIWYLGSSIKCMSGADVVACVDYFDDDYVYTGCTIEKYIARCYGVKTILVPVEYACPDIVEVPKNKDKVNSVEVDCR